MGRRSAVTEQRRRVGGLAREQVRERASDQIRARVAIPAPELEAEVDAEAEAEAEPEAGKADGNGAATDNVGEQSVEINVEGLIAELEAETDRASEAELNSARRKLEDYLEEQRIARALEDFDDFDI